MYTYMNIEAAKGIQKQHKNIMATNVQIHRKMTIYQNKLPELSLVEVEKLNWPIIKDFKDCH